MRLAIALLAVTALSLPTLSQEEESAAVWGNDETAEDAAIEPGEPPLLTTEDVKAQFERAFRDECAYVFELGDAEMREPTVDQVSYRYSSDEADSPDRTFTLYTFTCGGGAYNFTQVFYTVNEYGAMSPLEFATPTLDIRYEDEDFEKAVLGIEVNGWEGRQQLVNAFYDPDTQTITEFSKWRGIGDASTSAIYELVEDRFVLKAYDVDASYDGEINPETVVDYRATN